MTIKNTVNIKVAFFSTIQSSLASFDRNWCVFNIIQEEKKNCGKEDSLEHFFHEIENLLLGYLLRMQKVSDCVETLRVGSCGEVGKPFLGS